MVTDTDTTREMAQDLEAQAVMLESPVELKEVADSFILITYDLPRTEEGDKARLEFLKEARKIGAVQHTESVYIMPWTQDANVAAVLAAKVEKSKVFVWFTKVDPAVGEQLLVHYDMTVRRWFDEVDERLTRMAGYLDSGKPGLADRMLARTLDAVKELEAIAQRRRAPWMAQAVKELRVELTSVVNDLVAGLHSKGKLRKFVDRWS